MTNSEASAVVRPGVYPSNPQRPVHAFVPTSAKRVLDVGCNTGAFGGALKCARSVEVWGIEPNPQAAESARSVLDRVIVAPLSSDASIPDGHFDVITFTDVLEHFADPWDALRVCLPKLRPGGCVVASIPNVLFIENLLHMLFERDFRYEDLGIRDRTHLRFFTRRSAVRLFEESGYEVERAEGIDEAWWTPSMRRRLAFRLFGSTYLAETKYIHYVLVARPR